MKEQKNPLQKMAALDPNSTMARAYLLMDKLQCEALPVVHEGQIVGVLSIHDIEKLIQEYSTSPAHQRTLKVGNFMNSAVGTLEPSSDLAGAIETMLDKKIQSYVVMQGSEIIGILSKHNLLSFLASLCREQRLAVSETLKKTSS